VNGAEAKLQVMPGYRIKRSDLEVKFFVGLDAEEHRLSPDDPENRLRGSMIGLRLAVDLWYEPTAKTMAALDASLSTIATNHNARAAFGWRVFDDRFYLGPEIAYFGCEGYRHLRLGVHLTGLKTGDLQWSAAAGWASDSDRRASPYVRLGLMRKL
jgi:hypothetical protein